MRTLGRTEKQLSAGLTVGHGYRSGRANETEIADWTRKREVMQDNAG